MPITSPIADLLTRIRNAIKAKSKFVTLQNSKEKRDVLDVFQDSGYIKGYEVDSEAPYSKQLKIALKYNSKTNESAIVKLGVLSRPGLRKYAGVQEIPHTINGLGVTVVSTSKGVMSDKHARKAHVGGELICYIY